MLTAVVTVVIFLVMISLHEFGHFIMAKSVGVKVLEFAIGMGPAIFKKQGKETLYSLRILPIGGYCKLEGEDEKTDDERAFCNQKLWKRFLVVSAGAILNILLGFLLLLVINANSKEIATPRIDRVVEGSYLSQTDIKPGDEIIKINGKNINFYPDIAFYLDELREGQDIEITVERNGEKITRTIKPSIDKTTVQYGEDNATVISSINGGEETVTVSEYSDKEAAKEYIGKTVTEERLIIGFNPKIEKVGFLNNIEYSFHYTGFVVKMVYKGLIDLVTGKAGLEQVSGPVGIVDAVNKTVNSGKYWLINILNLTVLLTINLGVFNLLPLPALDGGRIFFMLIELVRGKPVPAEKEGMVHAIGLMLLLGFALLISVKDIFMLIK